MNRKAKRATAADPKSRIIALELENQSLRDALFSILRTYGRLRVTKETANSLQSGDGMDVKDLGDAWVFTYAPSNMVVPGGVENGQSPENGAA